MTSDAFNQTVQQVISQLSPVVDDFFACLQKEAEIIAKGTAEDIESITESKQTIVQNLEQTSAKAAKALESYDCELQSLLSGDSDTLKVLQQATLTALQNLSNRLTESFELNQANGIAVQTLSKINRFTLNLVTGQQQPVKLYGSKGTTESHSKTAGAKLGEA